MVTDALEAGTISLDDNADFLEEIEEYRYLKKSVCKTQTGSSPHRSDEDKNHIVISFLSHQLKFKVSSKTTIKEIKSFLGEQYDRDPRSFRLIFRTNELKVRLTPLNYSTQCNSYLIY